jgi:Gti1/Pac2 family
MSPTYQQRPTLQNARIRTAQDALQVFFAVARNVLTLLTRRLDADERKAIRSGNVYIWEDRSASTVDNGGLTMERWYACSLPPVGRDFALDRLSFPGLTECHGVHRAYERLVCRALSQRNIIKSSPLLPCRRSSFSTIREIQHKIVSPLVQGIVSPPYLSPSSAFTHFKENELPSS